MILDLEQADCPTELDCDVAIVGAGAVGLTMGVDLARRGVDVLLLEAGGISLESSSQAIVRGHSVGHALDGLHNARFRLLGGASNFWGGQVVRFDPIVFERRQWIGSEGWPFGRQELDPYYDRCGEMLGLPVRLEDKAVWERLGICPPDFGEGIEFFITRWLRNPVLAQVFKEDLAQPRLRTLVHANLVHMDGDRIAGLISGLQVRTLAGKTALVRPKRVVLACGTIENARVLLQPLSDGEPAPWAGNAWLGKGFLDHLDCKAGSVRVLDKVRFHKVFDNIYVDRFKYNPKLKLPPSRQYETGSLGIAAHFIFNSVYREHLVNLKLFIRSVLNGRLPANARQLPSHVAALWKVFVPLAVRYLRSNRAFNPADAGIDLILTTEQWPTGRSQISLSDDRDALGMRKVEVDWAIDGREIETMALFAEDVRRALLQRGLADLTLDPLLTARDARFLESAQDGYHQMGGARIGASPERGVVDENLKVHATANLYVAGAAVYPSSGFANPTFTAAALGLRLCDHLAKRQP